MINRKLTVSIEERAHPHMIQFLLVPKGSVQTSLAIGCVAVGEGGISIHSACGFNFDFFLLKSKLHIQKYRNSNQRKGKKKISTFQLAAVMVGFLHVSSS